MSPRNYLSFLSLLCLLAPTRALAENTPPVGSVIAPAASREAAREHYARGLECYSRHDYAGALRELEQAYALAPSAKLLFAMGQAHAGLKHYAPAVLALQGYLDGTGSEVPSERRAQVQRQLQAFRQLVGTLHVSSDVRDAAISIDGKAVGISPLSQPLLVQPGRHRVTASYATSSTRTTWIDVEPGTLTSLHFALAQRETETAIHPATPLWITTGVLAALAIGSAAVSFGQRRDYERTRGQPHSGDPAEASRALERERSRLEHWLLATDVLAGMTVLSGGAAIYFSVAPASSAEEPKMAGLVVGASGSF